jgi:hypothetical protein
MAGPRMRKETTVRLSSNQFSSDSDLKHKRDPERVQLLPLNLLAFGNPFIIDIRIYNQYSSKDVYDNIWVNSARSAGAVFN